VTMAWRKWLAPALGVVLLLSAALRADWPELRTRNVERQQKYRGELRKRIPKGHPRIFILGEKDLDEVRKRIKKSPEIAEVYDQLRDWAYTGEFTTDGWQPTLQLQARTVVYRLENRDPELLNYIVKQADWLCENELLNYIVKQADWLCENDLDEWSWAWIARSLAFVYDWCYDDLTAEQRERYGRRAMECAKTVYSLWEQPPTNNHVYLKQGMVLYPGVVLYGEGIDDAAAEQMIMDNAELIADFFIPVHEVLNAGDGGWQESMSYQSMFTFEFAHLLEAAQVASGENIWKNFKGLDGDAQYHMYCRRPFDNRKVRVADGGGGAVDTYISYYLPLLSRRRRDGAARYWTDWIRERAYETDDQGNRRLRSPHKWWPYVLWYDPSVPTPEAYPLARIFGGIGYVVSRSGWGEEDVFSMLICAPWWCGGHQHLDANSFIIHRYAPLAIDSGVQGYNITRGNYFARTIAHNTVTVYDPDETFTGGTWGHSPDTPVANDGGHDYVGGAGFPEDFKKDGAYNKGRILAFLHKPEYTYTVGDATRYFKPYKVREHQRAFLHIQPDLFIIFDRVEASSPSFKKRWLLHAAVEPAVNGSVITVKNGDGRLWSRTLLPEEPKIEVVGPPVLPAGATVPEVEVTAYPPGYPRQWRVEVSPTQPAGRDYFVHVLCTPAKGVAERPRTTLTQDEKEVVVTVTWAGRTTTVRLRKTGKLEGKLLITDADGKELLKDDLRQRVSKNQDLVKEARKK